MEVDDVKIAESPKKKSNSREYLAKVLFFFFGIGTWLNLNGVWIELPLLVTRLSEGWGLSPQLGMASNIANVGPLTIALIRLCIGQSSAYEVPSITLIYTVGIIGPIVLSFTWFKHVYFWGRERSLYLLVLSFFLALVNCTSSVTYLPFVHRFDKSWLNIYFAGEAFSSLIPALIGLLQGVGHEPECIPVSPGSREMQAKLHEPRFSVNVYLICLSVIMLISFAAFLTIWFNQKKFKSLRKDRPIEKKSVEEELIERTLLNNHEEIEDPKVVKQKEEPFSKKSRIYLAIVLWTSILLIGCIPSINSYSLNPYGSKTFHYVIILTQCCYPLVSFLANIFPKMCRLPSKAIYGLTLSGTLVFIYIFLTAIKSPCSPLVEHWSGSYVVGLMWILIYLIFYYERIALGNYFNEEVGHRGLFWYGLLTQAGAFTGALFIFLLNAGSAFQERDLCADNHCL